MNDPPSCAIVFFGTSRYVIFFRPLLEAAQFCPVPRLSLAVPHEKYFYFLQVTQMLPFCSALQSNAGIFEGARCSTSSRSPALLSLQKSPFKASHQYFSAAVFLSCLNKAFKLRLLDVKPDSEAVSSFVYPQLVRGCFVLFWDGCLLQSCAFSSPFLPRRAAHSALCR